MKEEIRDILSFQDVPFKVPILMYESIDEADKAAGVAGAALKACNNLLAFHGAYARGRELVVECIQELTKVPFLTAPTGEKDAEGKDIIERDWDKDSDSKYPKRALTLKAVDRNELQKLIETRARGYKGKDEKGVEVIFPALAVNIKAKARTGPTTKTLAKKFRDVAMEFLSGKKNLDKFTAVLTKQEIGTFTKAKSADGKELPLTAEENVVALGWLCKAWSDAQDVFKSVS